MNRTLHHTDQYRVVRHACQTAITLGIIGNAFDSMAPTARNSWFPLSKKQAERMGQVYVAEVEVPALRFPRGEDPYGQIDFNGELVLALLEGLSESYPYQPVHVPEAVSAARAVAKRMRTACDGAGKNKLELHAEKPTRDIGLAIPVGVAVGLYCALTHATLDMVRHIALGVAGACGIGATVQGRSVTAIAYLCWSLMETGYFCSEDIVSIAHLRLVSAPMEALLRSYVAGAKEPRTFLRFDTDSVGNLPYTEQVLTEAVWYLLRISTQFKDVPYSTVPKEQLNAIIDDADRGTDLAFLFGVLCTLSEQTGEDGCYKLVIPETLVSESTYADRVHAILSDIQ